MADDQLEQDVRHAAQAAAAASEAAKSWGTSRGTRPPAPIPGNGLHLRGVQEETLKTLQTMSAQLASIKDLLGEISAKLG